MVLWFYDKEMRAEGRHCHGSHLSSCLSSSLCFSCHCPLHGHGNPGVSDLHTGHFHSPLLRGTAKGSLRDKHTTRQEEHSAGRESHMVCPAQTERQGKPAQQQEGHSRDTSTQHGVCTVGTTASQNTCWSAPVSPVWLLSCLLNHDPHPFLRWALTKLLPFTKNYYSNFLKQHNTVKVRDGWDTTQPCSTGTLVSASALAPGHSHNPHHHANPGSAPGHSPGCRGYSLSLV